jgi:gliding motility-associated-like protein
LSVKNATNGCEDAVTKRVTLIDPKIDGTPDIPSIFTPEGNDELNKVFTYVAKTKSSDCATIPEFTKLQIFDRWGRMVYETTENFKWNGDDNNDASKNNPCPSDVYLYIFYLKDGNPLKGNVTLIR